MYNAELGLWIQRDSSAVKDLSDGSNRKVCLHLKFLRKSVFCFVSCLFGKVVDDFQKTFHSNVLAFLQGLYLASSAFKDYTKSLTIVLGLRKKQCWDKQSKFGAKKQIVARKQFKKSDLLGFTPKSLPILDFGVQHWKKRKNTTNNKKLKLFKMLY